MIRRRRSAVLIVLCRSLLERSVKIGFMVGTLNLGRPVETIPNPVLIPIACNGNHSRVE
jgi:hypothetical protein